MGPKLFFSDAQFHFCREKLHHHLPPAHRPPVAIYGQGCHEGEERKDGLKLDRQKKNAKTKLYE